MNQLTAEKIRLCTLYLSKKLESKTIKEILNSTYQTAYRLYLIVNGVKELQEFATLDSSEYSLTAYVKTEFGFVGDAKAQVWSITHLQPLLLLKPKYVVKCELKHLLSNNIKYRCILEHKNQEVVYNQIHDCIDNLNKILK